MQTKKVWLALTLTLLLSGGGELMAWTEPASAPPNGNVAAPLRLPLSSLDVNGVIRNISEPAYGPVSLQSWGLLNNGGSGDIYIEPKGGSRFFVVPSDWTQNLTTFIYGNVGIGEIIPSSGAKLDVDGQVKIRGGSPGAGKVLTSDASGLATWTTLPASSNGDITGVNAGSNLTGGGASGDVTLAVSSSPTFSGTVTGNRFIGNLNGNPGGDWGEFRGGNFNTNNTYAYNAICVQNASGVCDGANGVVLGVNNTAAKNNIPANGAVLLNSGNVGIGTSNPTAKFVVSGGESNFFSGTYSDPHVGTAYDAKFGGSSAGIAVRGNSYFAGNVGIGTNAPGMKLDVAGSIRAPGNPYPTWGDIIGGDVNSNNVYAYNAICTQNAWGSCGGANGVVLGINNTAAKNNIPSNGAVLLNSGNVGIGTTNPTAKLEVTTPQVSLRVGEAGFPGTQSVNIRSLISTPEGGSTPFAFFTLSNVDGQPVMQAYGNPIMNNMGETHVRVYGGFQAESLKFGGNYSSGGSLCGNSSLIVGYCTSLKKFKTDVDPISFGLDEVLKLRPVEFTWKEVGQGRDFGFIAEEVESVNPMLAEYGNGKLSGVKYAQMSALLVKAVQELKAENDELKARLERLEARIK